MQDRRQTVVTCGALFLLVFFCLAETPGSCQSREEKYQKKAAKVADRDTRGHYQLGLWCKKAGLEDRARKHFEKVTLLDPDHAGARRNLGYVRYRGQWMTAEERAEVDYRKKLEALEGADVKGHFRLGVWCRRKGLLAAAGERFRKVLDLDPENRAARRELEAVEAAVVEERVAAYVDAGEEKRKALLADLRKRDRILPGKVKSWIEFISDRLRKKPKHRGREVSRTHHPKFSVKYRLLGRTRGKNLSLLILLHGGGPSTQVNDRSWEGFKRFKDTPFDLVAVPRVWDDSTGAGWVMESGPLAVVSVLEEIKRAYDVDPDRIYLAGSSMGGYGTCWTGSLEADRFAALGVIAAGYSRGGARLANLLHTPVTCHIGENDTASDHIGSARELRDRMDRHRTRKSRGYECLYQEYPGMGHSLGSQAYRDMFEWMSAFKRNPAPRRIVWEPFTHQRYVTHKHYFYWLKLDTPRTGMRLEAEIREDNVVAVSARSVRSFTLFLNRDLIDPKRPVVVEVNGKERFNAMVEPSLTALLETLAAREDPHMIYPYRIDVGR